MSKNNDLLLSLRSEFQLTKTKLQKITDSLVREINLGITGATSSLDGIPTYLGPPSGNETGLFMAIDLGGTNLRVLLVELDSKTKTPKILDAEKRKLTKKEITSTTADLFGVIADTIKLVLNKQNIYKKLGIGFTFSFPMQQTAVNQATLIRWTKEFNPIDNHLFNIGEVLLKELAKRDVTNVYISAIINDTTGTLLTGAFQYPDCSLGMIIGTGTNICIKIPANEFKKNLNNFSGKELYINLESGNFNVNLPVTKYDSLIDLNSANKGEQLEEKMVSGKYLGLIASYIIKDFVTKGLIKQNNNLTCFDNLSTEHLSMIELDSSSSLTVTAKILADLNTPELMESERFLIKEICHLVVYRSAQIAAAMVAGSIKKIDGNITESHTVVIDGSLFEKYPNYKKIMEETLTLIFDTEKAQQIKLRHTSDGSGIGAAIAAAISS